MINIADVNRRLEQQDHELRAQLAATAALIEEPGMRAIAELLAAGLAAVHERQGNMIVLMLQTTN